MTDLRVRALGQADAPAVGAFLEARPDQSMFLRSQLRRVGLSVTGGVWAGAWEGAALAAVGMHGRSGTLTLVAPVAAAAVAEAALAASGRPCAGLVGPWDDVAAARARLGWDARPAALVSREDLFALPLAALVLPPALVSGAVTVGRARPSELAVLAEWRLAYEVEAVHRPANADSRALAVAGIARTFADDALWVARVGAEPVAMCTFNAAIPGAVQIGGVYTPLAGRARGFARACVAGALATARTEGCARAVLFTGVDNYAAQAAYRAIGFARVGDYGILLFR